MNLALRQNSPLKVNSYSKNRPLEKPRGSIQDNFDSQINNQGQDNQDAFNMTITDRRPEQRVRCIKRSVINRSCINTICYSCKDLHSIPIELTQEGISRLGQVQKIDLSFNNISDIYGIPFSKLDSLKELLLNDNVISELPFNELNKCKGLKILNVNNNKIYILPPLTKPSFIEIRMNPLRLVTSQLIKLQQIEFITFDWLEYLIQGTVHSQDKYKEYSVLYSKFKSSILQKIDYSSQDNSSFCDFHSFFSIRMAESLKKTKSQSFLTFLIIKSIHRNDLFFVNYLKNYQNQMNYAKMVYNTKLLLQIALDNGSEEVLELFRLKKTNYSYSITDELYFQSLKIVCKFSHHELFEFLFSIRNKRKKVENKSNIEELISQLLIRYDHAKNSHKILSSLINLYKETNTTPITIKIPDDFNTKIYRNYSNALLDIYQDQNLKKFFLLESQNRIHPLHFAMKSRNQELIAELLREDWNIFQRNKQGIHCKYIYGSTQVSRKMVWKKQKNLLKKQIQTCQVINRNIFPSNRCSRQTIPLGSKINIQLGESKESLRSLCSPLSCKQLSLLKSQDESTLALIEKILSFLFVTSKEYLTYSWSKDYSIKIQTMNNFISHLIKLGKNREESMMKRLENWRKIIDHLNNIFESLSEDEVLLKFQVIMSSEAVYSVREDRCVSTIKVEGQRASIGSSSFWCCQNLTDDV